MSEDQIVVQLNPDVPPTGSDLGVVNAARRSFGKRSEWDVFSKGEVYGDGTLVEYGQLKKKDKRLLEFLARGMTADDFEEFLLDTHDSFHLREEYVNKLWQWRNTPTHDTPFNHGFFSFEVKAPIFVRAQLVKHDYLLLSEFSRRYITDDVEFYEHLYRVAAENKKQGSGGTHKDHEVANGLVVKHNKQSILLYNSLVDNGVSPEQARGVLPQDLMTAWTWSGTLGAFANMCKLRLHPEAQYEARLVAQKVYEELKKQFPVSARLLVEGVV
jgi:thymidylate synthase (FAD)